MLTKQAVGIDLGTTYSCISHLNEHGEPVTIHNREGELATPSAILVDGDEIIVGTEALRNSIVRPDAVILNSKRHLGNTRKNWEINGRRFSPVDAASCILKKLIHDAQDQIGQIDEAVVTVPAQFTDFQRHATLDAAYRAGLQTVNLINEPVAAALCHVLGSEGLWFTELAEEQRILVYDLGGGTFDLSIVAYHQNEVRVIASAGDLELGGVDWTELIVDRVAKTFEKEFHSDPRKDSESLQALTLEAEQTKRSLTVRPRSSLTCQHDGKRKSYAIEQSEFEKLADPLVERTVEITRRMLKDNRMGWAHVDVVLTTGGSSRMPMIKNRLKKLSGRTLNTSLSPDQSISHGATYYAGMLISNDKFANSILNEQASARLSQVRQRSVNARALGVIVRDVQSQKRVPHYLIPANTTLPATVSHRFGTVVENQKRVHVQIVESAVNLDQRPVILGDCIIEGLPDQLPEGSEICVDILYDEQARVHVSARDVSSGLTASTDLIRQENMVPQLASDQTGDSGVAQHSRADAEASAIQVKISQGRKANREPEQSKTLRTGDGSRGGQPVPVAVPPPAEATNRLPDEEIELAIQPVPLCNVCGKPLNRKGECASCEREMAAAARKRADRSKSVRSEPRRKKSRRRPIAPPPDDDDILELGSSQRVTPPEDSGKPRVKPPLRRKASESSDAGEDEFWDLAD